LANSEEGMGKFSTGATVFVRGWGGVGGMPACRCLPCLVQRLMTFAHPCLRCPSGPAALVPTVAWRAGRLVQQRPLGGPCVL
jgi:hypothetical protein